METDIDPAPATAGPRIARLAVEVEPYHLDRPFDYLVPDDLRDVIAPGQRVQVGFAGRSRRALVLETADDTDVPSGRLRELKRRLGEHVWVRPDELGVLRWAAARWGAPLADVIRHALPGRTVAVERQALDAGWFPPGTADRPADPAAPDLAAWDLYGRGGPALRDATSHGAGAFYWRPVPGEDVGARLVELVTACLAGGRDALIVVPDPKSPAADAVVDAFGDLAVDVRGGPSPRLTYKAWLRARCGQVRVIVGERGVAFWPLERPGLLAVVDEASPALKERRSPRHHARDVVLERARQSGAVGLLVGRVPSAVAWGLLRDRRVAAVTAPRRQERSLAPFVDVDAGARTRFGRRALKALRRAVDAGSYGIVLAARLGQGFALVCSRCGTRVTCPDCASSVAPGRDGRVVCEGCGWQSRRRYSCPKCGQREFSPLAAGAERLGSELSRTFDVTVAVLEGYAQPAPPPPAVLVMTRGSVLTAPPGPVGAVVIRDLDAMLRRPTLDAAEDALRLAMQVADWVAHDDRAADAAPRRTDRAARAGGRRTDRPVVVQTEDPDQPAIRSLVAWDPGGFWKEEVALRRALRFPPAASAIRLDVHERDVSELDRELRDALPASDDLLGPIPRTDGVRYLLKCDDRVATLAALDPLRRLWSQDGLDVRIDVDPVDAL